MKTLSELVRSKAATHRVAIAVSAPVQSEDEQSWRKFIGKFNGINRDYEAVVGDQILKDPLGIKVSKVKEGVIMSFEYLREGKFVIEISIFEHNEKGVLSVQYSALNNIAGKARVIELVNDKLRAIYS